MSFSLKDQIYSPEFNAELSQALQKYYPDFNTKEFHSKTSGPQWQKLELKERMHFLALQLKERVSLNYADSLELFKKVIEKLPQHNFANIIFPDYVATFGIEELELSLDALELFTQYGSSEFAIRPFIVKYEEATMARMQAWTQNANHHIRRLASEGCRPRLPWGMALPKYKKDPSPILPILEALKADLEDYVYRSVANNLNDISKDNPDIAIEIGERWKGSHKNTDWAVKHGLRTLLKKGNPKAMKLFGYANPNTISIADFELPSELNIGQQLPFSFTLNNKNKEVAELRVEYAIEYLKKRGNYTKKVFMIKEGTFPQGASKIEKKQWFKDFSTRKHYPGEHKISLIVNGVEKAKKSFELKA